MPGAQELFRAHFAQRLAVKERGVAGTSATNVDSGASGGEALHFEDIDTNGDGVITRAEFERAAQRQSP
jgi:hypothetical protein